MLPTHAHLHFAVYDTVCVVPGNRIVLYPSDTRFKSFHTRTRSHEKRNESAIGVKRVHATNKMCLLLMWNTFSWLSKRLCFACETCFTCVSLACETRSPCRKHSIWSVCEMHFVKDTTCLLCIDPLSSILGCCRRFHVQCG